MASVHLGFKAELPAWEIAATLPLSGQPTRFGRQLAFVALMPILLLAQNRNIPYSPWRGWHKLSGLLFLVVIAHWLSIKSPILRHGPAGWWLSGMPALGVIGSAWKLLLYPWLLSRAESSR